MREQGGGGRSVWDPTRTRYSLVWRSVNTVPTSRMTVCIFVQHHAFCHRCLLNVMCVIIMKCAYALSEVYLRCLMEPRNKRSTFTECNSIVAICRCWICGDGIYRPRIPVQQLKFISTKASVQVITCWWNTHYTAYTSFIMLRLPTSTVLSDSRPFFIVLPPLGGVELGYLDRTHKSTRSPTP